MEERVNVIYLYLLDTKATKIVPTSPKKSKEKHSQNNVRNSPSKERDRKDTKLTQYTQYTQHHSSNSNLITEENFKDQKEPSTKEKVFPALKSKASQIQSIKFECFNNENIEVEKVVETDPDIRDLREKAEDNLKKIDEENRQKNNIERERRDVNKGERKKDRELDGKKVTFDSEGKPIMIKTFPQERLPHDFIATSYQVYEIKDDHPNPPIPHKPTMLKINAKINENPVTNNLEGASNKRIRETNYIPQNTTENIPKSRYILANSIDKNEVIIIGGKTDKQIPTKTERTIVDNKQINNQPAGSIFR